MQNLQHLRIRRIVAELIMETRNLEQILKFCGYFSTQSDKSILRNHGNAIPRLIDPITPVRIHCGPAAALRPPDLPTRPH